MKKSCIAIYFLVCLQAAYAQEELIDPPSRLLTRFPFTQLTGGVVMFKALLNNFPDTLNFILDSGSSGISLDSETVRYFNLTPIKSNKAIRGIAGVHNVDFLYNQSITLGSLRVDSLDFHINDYDVLSSVYGEKVDGIVGYSILKKFIIKVNYDSLTIDINTQGTIKYPRGGFYLRPIITTLPSTNALLRDENKKQYSSRFLFDIGAGLSAMFSRDYVEDSMLFKNKKMLLKTGEGVGGKINMSVTTLKEIRIGNYKFKHVPVYVFDDINNITSYPFLGGLIGNDIYRRFNIIFNYGKREFHMVPNSHFKDPFDYSYSGIELYLIDGQVVIGDLVLGSPGDEAGLKVGDIIIAIDNLVNQSLGQYKTALQQTNKKLKVTYNREGELLQTIIKIKSIK